MAEEPLMTDVTETTDSGSEPLLSLEAVLDLGTQDMAEVDRCIRQALVSDVVLVNQISEYIIGSGGKRLRPLLLCLASRACGYEGEQHWPLAAIIEFIHTATLLHDDVVDDSDTRRGQQTAHEVWGNSAAVLVGDFLYSRSFQLMVTLDSLRIMEILADTTNTIAEGEVLQLLNLGDPEVTREAYFRVIDNKTAKLFEAAGRLAAVINDSPRELEDSLAAYGTHLGRAFQMADDVLDYAGDASSLGKDVGDDLAEGKPTLPLILARERGTDDERALIDQAISQGGSDQLDAVLDIIRRTGSLATTSELAQQEAEKALAALSPLPDSPFKTALSALAHHSHQRTH